MPVPQVLVVAPPPIGTPRGTIAPKFEGGKRKCHGLAAAYKKVSEDLGCYFFDAGTVVMSSNADGVHLDAGQHSILGQALARVAAPLLTRDEL
jgi:lysophospholipase L1-like esterase